jgi:hypothetical protein
MGSPDNRDSAAISRIIVPGQEYSLKGQKIIFGTHQRKLCRFHGRFQGFSARVAD